LVDDELPASQSKTFLLKHQRTEKVITNKETTKEAKDKYVAFHICHCPLPTHISTSLKRAVYLLRHSALRALRLLLLLLLLKDLEQVLPHPTGVLGSVHTAPDALLLVVVDDGSGLLVVGSQALLEGLDVVVGTLDQGLAGNIVLHVVLGGVEDTVVRATGRGVDQTTGDTGDQQSVVDLELDGVVENLLLLGKHRVEALGLGDSPGETIKDEAKTRAAQC
jgi:hypothetical protein